MSQQIAFMQAEAERLVDALAMAASVAKVLESWDVAGSAPAQRTGANEGSNPLSINHDRLLASVAGALANAQRLQRVALQQLLQSSFDVTRHLHKAAALAIRGAGLDSVELPREDAQLERTPEGDREGAAEPRGLVVHLRPWMGDSQSGEVADPTPAASASSQGPQVRPLDGWARAVASHYSDLLSN